MLIEASGKLPFATSREDGKVVNIILDHGMVQNYNGRDCNEWGIFDVAIKNPGRATSVNRSLWTAATLAEKNNSFKISLFHHTLIVSLDPDKPGVSSFVQSKFIHFVDIAQTGLTQVRENGFVLPHSDLIRQGRIEIPTEQAYRAIQNGRADFENAENLRVIRTNLTEGTPVYLIQFKELKFNLVLIDPVNKRLLEREVVRPFAQF